MKRKTKLFTDKRWAVVDRATDNRLCEYYDNREDARSYQRYWGSLLGAELAVIRVEVKEVKGR